MTLVVYTLDLYCWGVGLVSDKLDTRYVFNMEGE